MSENGDRKAYDLLVLETVREVRDTLNAFKVEVARDTKDLSTRLTVMETKAMVYGGIWGAISGIIVSIITAIAVAYIKK